MTLWCIGKSLQVEGEALLLRNSLDLFITIRHAKMNQGARVHVRSRRAIFFFCL